VGDETCGGMRVQMAWHPMSNDHLVLLTTDARLCLYNVAADTQFPEQV
jgi:hypothetical protein